MPNCESCVEWFSVNVRVEESRHQALCPNESSSCIILTTYSLFRRLSTRRAQTLVWRCIVVQDLAVNLDDHALNADGPSSAVVGASSKESSSFAYALSCLLSLGRIDTYPLALKARRSVSAPCKDQNQLDPLRPMGQVRPWLSKLASGNLT